MYPLKISNSAEHDRHNEFKHANLKNLLDAVCGLLVLLSSQFYTENFSSVTYQICAGGSHDNMESAIGGYFRISFSSDWPKDQGYDFSWQEIQKEKNPFMKINYDMI